MINGKWLSAQPSGMQRYAGEVARRVLDLDPAARVVVPRDADAARLAARGARDPLAGMRGIAFEQLALPWHRSRRDAAQPRRSRADRQARPARRHARRHAGPLPAHLLARASCSGTRCSTACSPAAPATSRRSRSSAAASSPTCWASTRHGSRSPRTATSTRSRPAPTPPRSPSAPTSRRTPPTTTCSASATSPRARTSAPVTRALAAAGIPVVVVGAAGSRRVFAQEAPLDAPGIHLAGRLSDGELALLLRNARALVFPSLYEGFGLPLVEAQALGCPVIASDRASIPEVAGEGAMYFDPMRPQDAVARVQRARRRRAQSAGRAAGASTSTRFSWDRTAAILLGLATDAPRAGARPVRAGPRWAGRPSEDRAGHRLAARAPRRGRAVRARAGRAQARGRARRHDRHRVGLARGRGSASPPTASRSSWCAMRRPYPPDRRGSRPAAAALPRARPARQRAHAARAAPRARRATGTSCTRTASPGSAPGCCAPAHRAGRRDRARLLARRHHVQPAARRRASRQRPPLRAAAAHARHVARGARAR